MRALQEPNYKPSRKEVKELWKEAKPILELFGKHLPKQRLVSAITVLSEGRKRRFLRRRLPKYGSMNKGFTKEELVRFMSFVEDTRFVLLFTLQAVLGLRISEAVKAHVRDINLKTKELRIGNEKCNRTDWLPLPPQIFEQLLSYIGQHEQEVAACKGFLFYAERYPKNSCPHVSTNYVRNVFMQTVQKAKLDETYGITDGTRQPRLLHRLTTHSLRHYAITNFSQKNNGNVVLTSKFARHTRIDVTMTYIHTDKQELYQSMLNAQDEGMLERVRKIQNKIDNKL